MDGTALAVRNERAGLGVAAALASITKLLWELERGCHENCNPSYLHVGYFCVHQKIMIHRSLSVEKHYKCYF